MESCVWEADSNEEGTIWNTTCGNAFTFESGDVLDNGFAYCPYCGCALTMRAADTCHECDSVLRDGFCRNPDCSEYQPAAAKA